MDSEINTFEEWLYTVEIILFEYELHWSADPDEVWPMN